MSKENVEIVRATIDAFQRADFETSLSNFAEDCVWYPLVAGPYHGRAGVAKQMEVWVDEFNDYWFEGEELIDAGDEVVLLWRQGGEGKASGIRVEGEGATVFSIEDGRISRARVYMDRAEALEAAGLREAMSQENVEIVRDQYAATNERDFKRVMSHYAEDVELVVYFQDIRAGTFKGRDATGRWFGDWLSSFDRDARFDLKELTELEDGTVLVVADHHARGRASGAEVQGTVVWRYRLREGKIIRVEGYPSRNDALEAAGVRQRDDHLDR